MGAIYLIRHGQASFGMGDYDKLSELGHEQARVLGQALCPRVPDVHAVVTGSMRRHRQTAEGCLQAMPCRVAAREHHDFNEFDHQEIIERYQPRYANRLRMAADLGKTLQPRKAFQQMYSQAVARWVSGAHDADYTESWAAFRTRCLAAMQALVARLGRSKTALVVTSGGPITAVAQELLHIPDAHAFEITWTLANCGITKIIYGSGGMRVSTLNDHGHFEGERARLITYR